MEPGTNFTVSHRRMLLLGVVRELDTDPRRVWDYEKSVLLPKGRFNDFALWGLKFPGRVFLDSKIWNAGC